VNFANSLVEQRRRPFNSHVERQANQRNCATSSSAQFIIVAWPITTPEIPSHHYPLGFIGTYTKHLSSTQIYFTSL
jgi:hypothetical protein